MKSIKCLFLALIVILALTAFAPVAVPSKPGLVSPIGNTVKVDPDAVTLKWKKSTPSPSTSPITGYDVEVSISSAVDGTGAFQTTVDTGNEPAPVPVTSTMTHLIPPASLNYGTTYYWHVRSDDGVATSAWSAKGVFRVGVEPPTLTALAPPPAPDLLTLRPKFMWTPGAQNANSYTIQISIDGGFSTIYRTATILYSAIPANQYIPTTNLTANMDFYWRVRANNTLLGTSDWSTPGTFHTANPPTVPVLVSPNNTRVSPTPTLTWKQVSLQGEIFGTYRIEIFDTKIDIDTAIPVFTADNTLNDAVAPDPSLGLSTTTSYKVPVTAGLFPATTYYWRIKAFNADDEYSTSSLFTFYTSIVGELDATKMDPSVTLGNVPGLQGPAANSKTIPGFGGTVGDNINLLSLYPIFKWDAGALNVQTYTLQVATKVSGNCNLATPNDSKFLSTIINVSIPYTESEYKADLHLYPNYVLCWRIRGNHSLYGSSDWSDVQIFLNANPPGVPVPTGPKDDTLTNDSSPKFVWNKVSLPSGEVFGKYEVEISYNSLFYSNLASFAYPADTIPPYPDPISYPLPAPILPGNPVSDPIRPVTPPVSAFPLYPIIDQAHHADGSANIIGESWYQVEENETLVPPAGRPLYGAHRYYWRVRSYNSNGEYSVWSVSRSIRIIVDRPTNLTVTDCAGTPVTVAITPRPCFDWDNVTAGAHGYRIQIATKPTFIASSIVNTGYSGISEYQPTKDLPKDKLLYWRVVTINNVFYGISLPTVGPDFTSANPPNTPILIAPIANKLVLPTLADPNPVFTWKRTPYPFTTTFDYYEIEIAWDKNFTSLVEPAAQTTAGDEYETSYTIAPAVLTPARTYYWHVRACNDATPNQCSAWSTTAYFRTSVGVTTLVTPPDNTNPLRPLFEWSAVNDATGYAIRISKSAACNTTVMGATTSSIITQFQPKSNLAPFPTYYWCVRANSPAFGPGPLSAVDGPFAVP